MDEETEDRRRLTLPDRRKNTYEALERRLDLHIQAIEDRFQRWFIRGLVAFAIIALCSTAALVGFGLNLNQIKDNRRLFVRSYCETTNARHESATTALTVGSNEDIAKAPNEAAANEIRRRRDVTLALIDAIAPVEDCEFLVDLALGDAAPTPSPVPGETP